MSNNCTKISNTCTDTVNAPCVNYGGDLSDHTTITTNCPTIHDTTEDTYSLIDTIKQDIDVSDLELYLEEEGFDCIDIGTNPNVGDVIKIYATKICQLEQEIEALKTDFICNVSIEDCLNLSNLQPNQDTVCVNPLHTLKDVLQAIINKL